MVNKYAGQTRPRSKLQKIHTQENWVINFSLHPLPAHRLSEIQLSRKTKELIAEYNDITESLKEWIKHDADRTSVYVRELRKALSLI